MPLGLGLRMSRLDSSGVPLICCIIIISILRWAPLGGFCCSKSLTFNGTLHSFANCLDLQAQDAAIAWTLTHAATAAAATAPAPALPGFHELEIAFSGMAPSGSGWVGWGLNPSGPQMAGSSVWVAFNAANGSTLLPYQLTMATLGGAPLKCSAIDYVVKYSAVEIHGVAISMLLTLQLNASMPTTMYHVWNRGPSVSAFEPAPHSMEANDLKAVAHIDMSSELHTIMSAISTNQNLKNRHGIINTIAWGFLLPMGVMSARYAKPFVDPLWFYMHIWLQCGGYILAVSGWATGLQLLRNSHGVTFQKHRNIAMVLFALSSIQVMALLCRPKKENKIRKYWNIYHHSMGYVLISLGLVNVFIGLHILGPPAWSQHAFICGLVALGGMSLILECITWFILINKKMKECEMRVKSTQDHKQASNGVFGPTEHILRVL